MYSYNLAIILSATFIRFSVLQIALKYVLCGSTMLTTSNSAIASLLISFNDKQVKWRMYLYKTFLSFFLLKVKELSLS